MDNQVEEIVRCFNEKDVEGLKNMFCQHSKEECDLDTQIQNAYEFYKGECESNYTTSSGGGGASYREGVCVKKDIRPEIRNVVTNEDKEYVICYTAYIKHDTDPGRIGICAIDLLDGERNLLASIYGFTWLD